MRESEGAWTMRVHDGWCATQTIAIGICNCHIHEIETLRERLLSVVAGRDVEQARLQREINIRMNIAETLCDERDALRAKLVEVERERDEAIAECRTRKGWDQDIAYWKARCEAMHEALARIKDETLLGRSHELGTRIYDICNAALAAQEQG